MSARGALIPGFNAQAAAGEGQVILAARIIHNATDTQQLEPMVRAAEHELAAAGIDERIDTVLADTGYWNTGQMNALAKTAIETIIPTHATRPRAKRQAKRGAHADRIDRLLSTEEGRQRYRRRQQIIEPVFAHIKHLRAITRLRSCQPCRRAASANGSSSPPPTTSSSSTATPQRPDPPQSLPQRPNYRPLARAAPYPGPGPTGPIPGPIRPQPPSAASYAPASIWTNPRGPPAGPGPS